MYFSVSHRPSIQHGRPTSSHHAAFSGPVFRPCGLRFAPCPRGSSRFAASAAHKLACGTPCFIGVFVPACASLARYSGAAERFALSSPLHPFGASTATACFRHWRRPSCAPALRLRGVPYLRTALALRRRGVPALRTPFGRGHNSAWSFRIARKLACGAPCLIGLTTRCFAHRARASCAPRASSRFAAFDCALRVLGTSALRAFTFLQAFALLKMPEMTYMPSFLIRASFFRGFVHTSERMWSRKAPHPLFVVQFMPEEYYALRGEEFPEL